MIFIVVIMIFIIPHGCVPTLPALKLYNACVTYAINFQRRQWTFGTYARGVCYKFSALTKNFRTYNHHVTMITRYDRDRAFARRRACSLRCFPHRSTMLPHTYIHTHSLIFLLLYETVVMRVTSDDTRTARERETCKTRVKKKKEEERRSEEEETRARRSDSRA